MHPLTLSSCLIRCLLEFRVARLVVFSIAPLLARAIKCSSIARARSGAIEKLLILLLEIPTGTVLDTRTRSMGAFSIFSLGPSHSKSHAQPQHTQRWPHHLEPKSRQPSSAFRTYRPYRRLQWRLFPRRPPRAACGRPGWPPTAPCR